jgi:hypothetical protein
VHRDGARRFGRYRRGAGKNAQNSADGEARGSKGTEDRKKNPHDVNSVREASSDSNDATAGEM